MGLHWVSTRRRDPSRTSLDERQRGERQPRSAVRPRTLDRYPDEAGRCLRPSGSSQSRASQIPAQAVAASGVSTADGHPAVAASYGVTVGAGGQGWPSGTQAAGGNGGNSVFSTLTAIGVKGHPEGTTLRPRTRDHPDGDGFDGGGPGCGTTSYYGHGTYPDVVNATTKGHSLPDGIPNTGGGGTYGNPSVTVGSGSGGSGLVIIRLTP
jgi:hypothetical protein